MAKAKTKTEYRVGTMGWFLIHAGWTPIEQSDGSHPLWRYGEFDPLLTGWEAWRLELLKIHNEFKAKR